MTSEIRLSIRHLRKSFGDQVVLADVSLDIAAGETLVLFGASASGKSVLGKCVLGLMAPDGGSIRIDGQETAKLGSEEREKLLRRVGVLFQNGALFDSLPIWHNIAFGLINGKTMAKPEARALAIRTLADVGLTPDAADLLPSELSGGMQKRVALARAIIGSPEIAILDAPTDGLDPIVTTHIDRMIVRSLAQINAAALVITQDIESARRIGSRAAFLHQGRIVWQGPMSEIDRSGNRDFDAFLGSDRRVSAAE